MVERGRGHQILGNDIRKMRLKHNPYIPNFPSQNSQINQNFITASDCNGNEAN